MNDDILPAPPFRPLPKIVAHPPDPPEKTALRLGDLVNIKITPRTGQSFWRLYEVTVIDGETCRLVTPDKRFHMNARTAIVQELRDLQRRLQDLPQLK